MLWYHNFSFWRRYSSPTKMQLNLSKKNAVSLKLEVDLQLDESIVNNLGGCFSKKYHELMSKQKVKNTFYFFGDNYKAGNKKHYSRGLVWKYSAAGNKYHIEIEYSVGQSVWEIEPPKELPSLSELLKCLAQYNKEISTSVTSNHIFPGEKYQSAIVNLPLKLERDEPFNEIRGLRLSKTQDGNLMYSVIIDRPGNEDFYCGTTFQYTGKFSLELPENVIQYATQIAQRAINEI